MHIIKNTKKPKEPSVGSCSSIHLNDDLSDASTRNVRRSSLCMLMTIGVLYMGLFGIAVVTEIRFYSVSPAKTSTGSAPDSSTIITSTTSKSTSVRNSTSFTTTRPASTSKQIRTTSISPGNGKLNQTQLNQDLIKDLLVKTSLKKLRNKIFEKP